MGADKVTRSLSEYWHGTKAYATIVAREKSGERIFVSRTDANERAQICARCPLNMAVGGFDAITDKLMTQRREERRTDHDGNLRNCDACGCPLKLMVHLEADLLRELKSKEELFARIKRREKATRKLIHPECWQVKLFEDS